VTESFFQAPVNLSEGGLHYLVTKVVNGLQVSYDWDNRPLDQGRDFILPYNVVDTNLDWNQEMVTATDFNLCLSFYKNAIYRSPGGVPLSMVDSPEDHDIVGYFPSPVQLCDFNNSGAIEYIQDVRALYSIILNPNLRVITE